MNSLSHLKLLRSNHLVSEIKLSHTVEALNLTKMIELVIPVGLIIIDLCLSVACLTMGTLHLKECENQAAIFLEVNGGITLLLVLMATALASILPVFARFFLPFVSFSLLLVPPFVSLVKLALAIYGSIVIFGEFEAQIQAQ